MTHSNSLISKDMADEILAEASRLRSEASSGYSCEELQQACLEAGISTSIFQDAVRRVEAKHYREPTKTNRSSEIQDRAKRPITLYEDNSQVRMAEGQRVSPLWGLFSFLGLLLISLCLPSQRFFWPFLLMLAGFMWESLKVFLPKLFHR